MSKYYGVRISEETYLALKGMKEHPRQPFDEVIGRLVGLVVAVKPKEVLPDAKADG